MGRVLPSTWLWLCCWRSCGAGLRCTASSCGVLQAAGTSSAGCTLDVLCCWRTCWVLGCAVLQAASSANACACWLCLLVVAAAWHAGMVMYIYPALRQCSSCRVWGCCEMCCLCHQAVLLPAHLPTLVQQGFELKRCRWLSAKGIEQLQGSVGVAYQYRT